MDREERIEELWNRTIARLLTEVNNPDSAPAMVGSAIKFLKDNQIEVLPATGSSMADTDFPFIVSKTG